MCELKKREKAGKPLSKQEAEELAAYRKVHKSIHEVLCVTENDYDKVSKQCEKALKQASNMSDYIRTLALGRSYNQRMLVALGYIIGRDVQRNEQKSTLLGMFASAAEAS